MLTEPVTCSTCGSVSVNGGTIHCNTCFERAQLGIGEGTTRPHGSPEQCPTYYDGCNCTVEVLVHNIERAKKAEAGNRLADLEEELERSNKFLEDAKAAFNAKVDVLEADLDRYREMVSPANAIDLGEFIGPVKPCPFCGSVALERDGFEEHIVCKNCGASAPVGGWQFRAPQL